MSDETTYMIDGIREYLIQTLDPREIGPTPIDGVYQKEKILEMVTVDFLKEQLGEDNYNTLENMASQIGTDFTKFALGNMDLPDFETQTQLPTLSISDILIELPASSSSSSSSEEADIVYANTFYYSKAVAVGGSFLMSKWEYEWVINKGPTDGVLIDNEQFNFVDDDNSYTEIISKIKFTEPGVYTYSFKLSYPDIDGIELSATKTVTVYA